MVAAGMYGQVAAVLLCVALQRWGRWLQGGLGHPRDGGWLLASLPERRRASWLRWAINLRARRAHFPAS